MYKIIKKSRLTEMEQRIDTLKNELDAAQLVSAQQSLEIKDLKELRSSLLKDNESRGRLLNDYRSSDSRKNEEIAYLTNKVNHLAAMSKNLEERLDIRVKDVEDLKTANMNLSERLLELEAECNMYKNAKEALQNSNSSLVKKYDQLEVRMARSKETSTAMRGHLKDTIKEQDKTIKDLRLQIAELTDKLNRALDVPAEEPKADTPAKPKRTYKKRTPKMAPKRTRKSNPKNKK